MKVTPLKETAVILFLLGMGQMNAPAQFTPADFGQILNGFQDDFGNAARDSNWVAVPTEQDLYLQTNGVLKVLTTPGAPNHLLYVAPGYHVDVQEVLARVRVTAFGTGDASYAGIGVAVNPDSPHPGEGINLVFRDFDQDGVSGRQFKLLDDYRAWGPPGLDLDWVNHTWYWLRLRQAGSSSAGGDNIQAKVWLADGTVSEPTDWAMSWGRDERGGFAGITGTSGGLAEFEVDYILIKAEGLPDLKVGPDLMTLKDPVSATVSEGQTATFTISAPGSSPPTYQWQKADPGTTNFTDIAGATAANYTTASLTLSNNGTKYRCVVSVPGSSLISQEATLTVEEIDRVKPILVSARTLGNPNQVTVVFSEGIALVPVSGANFSIDNGIEVTKAVQGADATRVELATSAISLGKTYTLTVNGVRDLSGNEIVPNSQIPIDLWVEVPVDYGQPVNGFQDDFNGLERDPNWVAVPAERDLYQQTNGMLKVLTTPGAPNHLLYVAPGYHVDVQEVLARIRVTTFSTGDASYAGIGVAVNPDSPHPGEGINLVFRDFDQDGVSGRQFKLLDDYRAWGPPGLDLDWVNHTWYWLRLRQAGSSSAGGDNIQAKVWLADGTVSEPTDWAMSWGRDERGGFAGIAGTSGGLAEFEVDYILIKAEGLPGITVAPSSFALVGPRLELPRLTLVREGSNAVLTWTGGGILESADTVIGRWTEVIGATTPQTAPISGTAKFYRVRR